MTVPDGARDTETVAPKFLALETADIRFEDDKPTDVAAPGKAEFQAIVRAELFAAKSFNCGAAIDEWHFVVPDKDLDPVLVDVRAGRRLIGETAQVQNKRLLDFALMDNQVHAGRPVSAQHVRGVRQEVFSCFHVADELVLSLRVAGVHECVLIAATDRGSNAEQENASKEARGRHDVLHRRV